MDLAWIAAVLAPRDVATHPNFPDQEYDSREAAQLASLILGRFPRSRRAFRTAEYDGTLLSAAERCLDNDTRRAAVRELDALLAADDRADPARSAAYTLILCTAAAELDDYDTCLSAVDRQLDERALMGADGALVAAVLAQQKALRLRDSGAPHLDASKMAATMLSRLDPGSLSSFPLGPNVERPSSETLRVVIDNLRDAIGSLVPLDAPEREEMPGLLDWTAQVRGLETELTVRSTRARAETYSNYVRAVFTAEFDQHTRVFGGPGHPDLISALALELTGDGSACPARRDLALLRLVRSNGSAVEMADSLRLLRHGVAKKELTLVLRQLRHAGPLAAIDLDARQILRTRTAPRLLRTVEMQVLEAAAQLLDPGEAREALDAVMAVLAAGGPWDLPGSWELPVLRWAVAWSAAAALSNVCAATGEVAEFFLQAANAADEDDQLFDRSLRRALGELQWHSVPEGIRHSWYAAREALARRLPGTVELVSERADSRVPRSVTDSPLLRITHELNFDLSGRRWDLDALRDGPGIVREELARIRSSAVAGRFATRETSPADVAAGLLVAGFAELWPDLAQFLLDVKVRRTDRTAAFERLAAADLALPEETRTAFAGRIRDVLHAPPSGPDRTAVRPYPAALRFAAVHGLLEEDEIYDALALLLGAPDDASRREGTHTVTLLARKRHLPGLLPMVLPLSADGNVEVRAQAGRAIVLLAGHDDALAKSARRRVRDLLAADGTLVPAVLLDALRHHPAMLGDDLRALIADLGANHPWRAVRESAGSLVADVAAGHAFPNG